MQRTILYLVCVAALVAWPQTGRAERELGFAKGLTDKGFYDLATEQYQLLEADEKGPADQRALASVQLADCYQKAGEAALKPELKDEFLAKASSQLEKFLKAYKTRPEAGDARYRIAIINQTRGLDKDKLIQATQDSALQNKLKEEAAKLFTEAANTFGDVADDLEGKVKKEAKYAPKSDEKPDPKNQEMFERYLLARGQMGWTYYYMGQLYSRNPKDADKMKKQYLEASNAFQSFLKDYPNYFISLWVQCGLGLVYRGQGDMEKAIDQFRRVVMKRRSEEANPIRYQAYYWLVETYRMAKNYDDSIRTANRFISEVPETFNAPIAQAIKLEKAKAYWEQAQQYKKEKKDKEAADNIKKAGEIAGQIVKGGGEYAEMAGKVLGEWGFGGGDTERAKAVEAYSKGNKAMSEAKGAADKKVQTAKYEEAIKQFKVSVEYADPETEAAMVADAWYNLGQCNYFLNRFYEAGLCFGELGRRFPENQFAPKAAYLASVFFGQLYQNTPEPRDYEAELYLNALIFFVEKFPKDPQAPKFAFQVGDVLWKQKRFMRAADIYSNIPAYSEYYERACYMSGNCYWLGFLEVIGQDPTKANSDEAKRLKEKSMSRLTEFVDWTGKQPSLGAQKDAERAHWVGLARVRLGSIYVDEFVRQPQPAIDILKGFETMYPNEQKSFPEVACTRVMAMAWTNQLPQAIQQMEILLAQYKTADPKAVSKTSRTIGAACAAIVEKPTANLSAKDVEAYRAYSSRYLVLSIEVNPDQPFLEYSLVADRLAAIKDFSNAAQVLVKGMTKYQQEIVASNPRLWWSSLAKVAEWYFSIGQYKAALEVYKQLDAYLKNDPKTALAFKENMGLCYESLGQWLEALNEAWNILNDKLPQNTPKAYDVKIHQIHCLAKLGDDASAYKNVIQWALFSWETCGEEVQKRIRELVDKDLPTHKQEFEDFIKKLAEKK